MISRNVWCLLNTDEPQIAHIVCTSINKMEIRYVHHLAFSSCRRSPIADCEPSSGETTTQNYTTRYQYQSLGKLYTT